MFGRLFGRHNDESESVSCAECGRTLLPGEWTQRLVDDGGDVRCVCALCSRPAPTVGADHAPDAEVAAAPVGSGRVKSSRNESDAFWRAMKDKDAEIERLESRLARAEAEKQELAAELSRLKAPAGASEDIRLPSRRPRRDEPLAAPDGAAPIPEAAPTPAVPPAETPLQTPPAAAPVVPEPEPVQIVPPPIVTAPPAATTAGSEEVTMPGPGDELAPDEAPTPAAEPVVAPPPVAAAEHAPAPAAPALADGESGASLTILQRGVDLLNVSAVPRRIVETIENLGMPSVHVGSADSGTLLVTFMWTLGWYQFRIDLGDGGRVTLSERGYDDRGDLQPNATVRPDGTVQLAPTFGKPPSPKEPSAAEPPTTTSGVIISKSLMGQRTDDENVQPPWESTQARDFDWGR
jgi:hypothetical protein